MAKILTDNCVVDFHWQVSTSSRREDEDNTPITVSRSRRPIRAHFHLHFEGTLIVDISNNLIEKETKEYSFPCLSSNILWNICYELISVLALF